ncbi:hypothetical protein Tco_1438810 [Tanacetum coccineum]
MEDPRSRLAGDFPPNIARPFHGAKLLDGPASVDFNFCSELVMKRVAKTIVLMDTIAKINDPQCELQLIRACTERIGIASGPGFGDWQWRLSTLPFAFGGLSVHCAGDVLNYSFLASRLQSTSLQTKLLRHSESIFSLSSRHMALWKSQMEDHTFDWLRVVLAVLGLLKSIYGGYYGDHAISCAGIISIKHRHNVVRDTLIKICFRSGILAGKEVNNGLGGGCDKPLCPTDMLLYSEECNDLTEADLKVLRDSRH